MSASRERGFTLIELMVVIVLIGILAGFVAPKVIPLLIKGKKTAAQSQIKLFEDSLELYYISQSRYPDSLEELTQPVGDDEEGIIDEVPLDPWGEEYIYDPSGGGTKRYLILSKGPDLVEGTEDDITNESTRRDEGQ